MSTHKFELHYAISEDIANGWIWVETSEPDLASKLVAKRRLARVSHGEKAIFCEIIHVGDYDLERFNHFYEQHGVSQLHRDRDGKFTGEERVFINHWYRRKLGIEVQAGESVLLGISLKSNPHAQAMRRVLIEGMNRAPILRVTRQLAFFFRDQKLIALARLDRHPAAVAGDDFARDRKLKESVTETTPAVALLNTTRHIRGARAVVMSQHPAPTTCVMRVGLIRRSGREPSVRSLGRERTSWLITRRVGPALCCEPRTTDRIRQVGFTLS